MSQSINVMFVCNEWRSSKGGLPTFNREFAVNLAKAASDRIKVFCYVCSSSEEDILDAKKQGVNLITAQPLPGFNDPMEWLKMLTPEIPTPDVVVGHGRKFGRAALFISKMTKCKWIHFVHVFCEDLGKHKLEGISTPDAIADNEEKNKQELELCETADLAVAVGSRLQRKYRRSLPDIKVEVITPGIFQNFLTQVTPLANVQPAEAEEFSVFMIGRGSFEDFALKGYDIVGKAVALLGRKFELTFVGSPKDEQRRTETWFLEKTKIARNQLTIRGYRDNKEMKKMFRAADLIVMPSRTEGFGLVALEAISAGVPVLVSSESGIAKALEKVEGGRTVVVYSDKPEAWAERIKQLSEQKPEDRHASAMHLRDKYGETYTWTKQCERFEQMIHGLIQRPCRDSPSNVALTDGSGATASPSPLEADSNQERDSATRLRDANRDTASPSSSKSAEADSDRKGDSARGQTVRFGAECDSYIVTFIGLF
ncbi:uncharacterized protein LOC110058759 [Orbicella faveolata]|uniref:uncharacterized protein LOC110058759 n=1 Tax=Orbicella faveolata TaxID=48498 RepID=UPI0009E40B27|nr:uncharacterized protein LOC110058759 [Orbicella faveolata]